MADTERTPAHPPRPATTVSPDPSTPASTSIPTSNTATNTNATPTAPMPTPAPRVVAPTTAMPGGLPTVLNASRGFRQKLDAGERHWRWKVALRAFLIIVGIVGIGCVGFATAVARSEKLSYEYGFDDEWALSWCLITFAISVVWCAIVVLVLLIRKAPVHPGVAVSVDLILWLAYIPTALFAIVAVLSVISWGENGRIYSYSSSGGDYLQASNGTWVWNATQYSSSRNTVRDCDSRSSYSSYSFKNCEEQDAYINAIWESKGHRAGIEIAGVVCQFIGLVFHLGLFIWACVDTYYRNSKKVSKDAEQLAADIVMNMVKSGAIIPAPSSNYYPPAQNPNPHQQPVPYHQQVRLPPPTAWTGPEPNQAISHQSGHTSEKGHAPRFA